LMKRDDITAFYRMSNQDEAIAHTGWG
jgi:hypothetical protein